MVRLTEFSALLPQPGRRKSKLVIAHAGALMGAPLRPADAILNGRTMTRHDDRSGPRIIPPALGPGGQGDAPVAPAKPKTKPKVERPRLYKVLLINDDYTPRDFVVMVLQAEFAMSEDRASQVMLTAHRKGSCVISVYPRDVAETKAMRATEYGKKFDFPLQFVAEPEE